MRKHILLAGVFPLLLSSPSWADFSEGTRAYDRGDYATAMNELHPLAEEGLASAQFYLGVMSENGQGTPQDYQEAARWYRKAAAQGHSKAMAALRQFPGPPTPVETPKTVEPPERIEPQEKVEPPKKAEFQKKVPKNITPKLDQRGGFERTVGRCTKEVQRAFSSDSFDAYTEGTHVRFFGTPEANFKFKKCMSRNGHPLVADQ